jgi:exodeoxyribonuclease V alpha subunit
VTLEVAERLELVYRAGGLLGEFNRAGVLGYADVHVALRLGQLTGESDESVLLAAALAVRAVRQGSVCIAADLVAKSVAVEGLTAEQVADLRWPEPASWTDALSASRLVEVGADGDAGRPLRFANGLLYLDRFWRQERVVAEYVDRASSAQPPNVDPEALTRAMERLFPASGPDRQRLAAAVAAHRWFSIVAGGPGTGKTTTVARLLAVLQELAGGHLRVALAAPTGKAAARLTEAVTDATSELAAQDQQRLGALTAKTLHRLLGSKRGTRTRFWHDRQNRLPYDVVVVDEASMVSLTMMSRLVEALRTSCRLILVGDPDQLSSVEVGAVLGDLVHRDVPVDCVGAEAVSSLLPADVGALPDDERDGAMRGGVVRLSEVHRFSREIQDFAEAIRTGSVADLDRVLAEASPAIDSVDVDPGAPGFVSQPLQAEVVSAGRRLVAAARAGDAEAALSALSEHRVLCAHREGPYGVARWAGQVETWLSEAIDGYARDGLWYIGRPLLVTANDYQLGLFNGDTGVVVAAAGQPRAAFAREGRVDLIGPSRLGDVQTVHAMSIHRSQGSQFDAVTVVLPPPESPLLTRELLYTAVTRAKQHVRLIATHAALARAVETPIVRASGLRNQA